MRTSPEGNELSTDLLDRVEKIEPIIRRHVEEAERNRRLSRPVVDAMRETELYNLARPRELGGLEVEPVTMFRIVEAVARIDSAPAWNLAVSLAMSFFPAWLREDGVSEILSSEKNLIWAAAFHPPVQATPCEGGFTLSGRVPFLSGALECDWFILPALVVRGAGETGTEPEQILAFFPSREAEVLDTWNTLGMRGTGSHDIVVSDLFVPNHCTAPMLPLETPNRAYRGPLYRLTVWAPTALVAPPVLGMASAAILELIELARAKTPAYTVTTLRERPVVQRQVAEALSCVDAARSHLHATFQDAWAIAVSGSPIDLQLKAKLQAATCLTMQMGLRAIHLVYSAAGTTSIRTEYGFERHFRDVHTLSQHAYGSASRLESVGQILFGLEPEWPFFAF